jgi:hypothetical protein
VSLLLSLARAYGHFRCSCANDDDDASVVVVMTRAEKRRALQHVMRASHRKVFDLQGDAIVGLREALNAISRTHNEMMVLFDADEDLEGLGNDDETH